MAGYFGTFEGTLEKFKVLMQGRDTLLYFQSHKHLKNASGAKCFGDLEKCRPWSFSRSPLRKRQTIPSLACSSPDGEKRGFRHPHIFNERATPAEKWRCLHAPLKHRTSEMASSHLRGLRRFLSSEIPSCWSFRPSSVLRQPLPKSTGRRLPRLMIRTKIWPKPIYHFPALA